MVPLMISHEGAVHKDTVKWWHNFAPDVKVGWVWVPRTCFVITLLWGNEGVMDGEEDLKKGSWTSETWRKSHPQEFEDEPDCLSERISTTEERRDLLHNESDPKSSV